MNIEQIDETNQALKDKSRVHYHSYQITKNNPIDSNVDY